MQPKSFKTSSSPDHRFARIERDEVVEITEDENSHLWAVAYSDLLMVLLSFFILFFSIDNTQRDNLIIDLARGIASEAKGLPTDPAAVSANALYMDLKKLDIHLVQEKENLTINFRNELFKPGKYQIDKAHAVEITKALELLAQHKNKINIYFEGHADSTPILHAKNNVVQDNFVLSSLRATQALQLARKMGFPEKQLFAQASSSNTRNSRSLSIRIEPAAMRTTAAEKPAQGGL